MSNRLAYSLHNPPKELADIDFKALDLKGEIALPPYKIASRDNMLEVLDRALDQSLLRGQSNAWFRYASVCKSLSLQVRLIGDKRRDFGDISFLTHLMEVTDWVFNCPELKKFPAELRAFVPVNHDLEDIAKAHGVQPFFLRNEFLSFLPANSQIKASAAKNLYLLMDPPTIEGDVRKSLQIARIPDMDEVGVYTRFADKYQTYKRDLHNMRTLNPATGQPFLHFKDMKEAEEYLTKMLTKQEIVLALPVADKYKAAWNELRLDIKRTIDDQFDIQAPGANTTMLRGQPTRWTSPAWYAGITRGVSRAAQKAFANLVL